MMHIRSLIYPLTYCFSVGFVIFSKILPFQTGVIVIMRQKLGAWANSDVSENMVFVSQKLGIVTGPTTL